jgi:hypothetical protein
MGDDAFSMALVGRLAKQTCIGLSMHGVKMILSVLFSFAGGDASKVPPFFSFLN